MFDKIPKVGAGDRIGDSQQLDGSPVGSQDFSPFAEGNYRFTDPVDESLQFIPFPLQGVDPTSEFPPMEKYLTQDRQGEGSEDESGRK